MLGSLDVRDHMVNLIEALYNCVINPCKFNIVDIFSFSHQYKGRDPLYCWHIHRAPLGGYHDGCFLVKGYLDFVPD